jgi:hypothetical protein
VLKVVKRAELFVDFFHLRICLLEHKIVVLETERVVNLLEILVHALFKLLFDIEPGFRQVFEQQSLLRQIRIEAVETFFQLLHLFLKTILVCIELID